MNWKLEVLVENKWASNACVYATQEEVLAAGQELLSRWFVPTDYRAVESSDPVNYRFDLEKNRWEGVPT